MALLMHIKNFAIDNTKEKFQPVQEEKLLWNNKPLREDSILLWDLENIAFNRLSEIKRVVKYTPENSYVITKQKLSKKKRAKIESEHFKILDAHKTISDDKIISLMQLYREKRDMILISSDADFAREANKYLKNGRLHWIVGEQTKKRVTMFVKLDSPNLKLSSIPTKKETLISNKRAYFKKKQASSRSIKIENEYGLKTYLLYYFGRIKSWLLKVKSLFIKQEVITAKEQHDRPVQAKSIKQKQQQKKKRTSEKFGLHTNETSGVSYRYIYRINTKGRMSICGKVQYNTSGEILLMLHKNLKEKYDMPSYKKLIRLNDVAELEQYVRYETQRDIYFLNDFIRVERSDNTNQITGEKR